MNKEDTLKSLQYHLDVIVKYSKLHEQSKLLRHKKVADQSRKMIVNTVEYLLSGDPYE